MITALLGLLDVSAARRLRLLVGCIVAHAILQGLAFATLVPFLSGLFSADDPSTWRWLVVLIIITVAYAAVFWAASRIAQRSATEVLENLLRRLGDRIVQLPIGWFGTDRSGDLADTATRGVVFAASAPYAILRPIIGAYVTPVVVVIVTFAFDWRIALTMAIAGPLIWWVHRWVGRRVRLADLDQHAAVSEASARVIEFAKVQPALRAAGDQPLARELLDRAIRQQHTADRRLHVTGGVGLALSTTMIQMAIAALTVVGVWLALGGSLALATLIPLLVLAVRFTEPIAQAAALGGALGVAQNTLDKVSGLLAEPTLPEPATPAVPRDHSIEFRDVTFGYGGEPVLQNLSFGAAAGTLTAIVGPSGSGKTTIIRLLARFHDPAAGSVRLGGVALPDLGSDTLAAAVAPVFQDVYLFDGTIADNIGIGDPAAMLDQIIAAGATARVDEIVERLPGGWDARVGEGGASLSGGERQRISIARALLKNAPIVLLDEATAALDVDNEQAIHETIDGLRGRHTVVVVAHRLQTIAGADQIIMLDNDGAVGEQGTHAELLAARGAYARYWNDRSDAAGWRLPGRVGRIPNLHSGS